MTRNKLTEALDAIDKGESPFNEPPLDTPLEPSVAPKAHDAWNRTVFQDPQPFGAIPATDHDALEAELADGVEKMISTREATHGDYANTARVAQLLKKVIALELNDREYRGQPPLTDRQHESIDLICTKLARIVSGDSGFGDHWRDVSGYAKIAIDEVK